jgi:RsiW-degrading membrane proteinase PrsW (M82 family)
LLWRWLISALVHVTATSTIGYLSFKLPKSLRLFVITVIGLVSWVLLHTTYNLSLYYSLSYLTIPLVIILFFLMSFFLFQSDILYLPADKDPKENI